jgi:homoprotocatechuate degradation regulator HpaR
MSDDDMKAAGSAPTGKTANLLPSTRRSLPIAMLRGRETVMGPYRRMLAKIGVTEQQWRVLRVLDERGMMDPKEIAEAACLLNPSLTRIMQLLDKKGLISRKGHPEDRRRVQVNITDEGRKLLVSAQSESVEISERLRERVGQEKLDALLDMLVELTETDLD